ncbi:hypothetical protein FB565_007473 [Actinoplanes lutulentus]|uniref:Carbohydrate binding protein with CBM6 domain n=1 Tax=Actinoplanes lutulentus TaxID=1287878 RepID=A0A327Z939_9ACTN|nr:DUF1996 domain-containing protein [Actinoplanes lutulentus]MBB2947702.1 hypothetical protein [Actinoplanes lutulentus]RAK27757.1 carbohydrate binding protein with CBM6 domain [Actinoplanes lutulentus]
MRTDPQHVAPANPKTRRRATRVALAVTVTAALAASGIYIATANAGETGTAIPGALQAEAFSAQSGAQTESTGDTGGGTNVGWLKSGDWLRYDGVQAGASIAARIASDNTAGGTIELRAGTPTGALLASIPVAKTGGWQKWVTVTATAKPTTGKQNLVAVMKSKATTDFVNINWFKLSPDTTKNPTSSPSATKSATAKPTTASPTTKPATKPPTGGWVEVDQTLWKQQLADFEKLKPAPIKNNPVKVPEFHVNCTIAKQSPDDAIVFPNLPGASHMHTFFGPDIIGASTTTKDLLAAKSTSCQTKGDNSAYWMPQLTQNGKPVPLNGFRIYYGSRLKDPSKTKILPPGLVMIAGDAKRQEPTPKNSGINQFWCAGAAETGRSADGNWPKCATGGRLIISITFPDCWDGKHVDSPDHKSHVGPTGPDGTCASGKFPVAIPSISELFTYESQGGEGFTLASGLPSSAHMDMMNGWDPKVLGPLVRTCLTQGVKCGTTPTFD